MMVEAGHFAICLAVVCALLQATALPLSGALKRPALAGLASLAAVVRRFGFLGTGGGGKLPYRQAHDL
jgi:cytochrome c biogenesis factor